jgi:hypothetical protein
MCYTEIFFFYAIAYFMPPKDFNIDMLWVMEFDFNLIVKIASE